MLYYLAPYIGTGRDGDAYRPCVEADQWASIDLRPDGAIRDGYALVAVTDRQTDPHVVKLGEMSDTAHTTRRILGNRLGLTLAATSFAEQVAELLIVHARTDASRWNPLQPSGPWWEIWLGGLLWRQPSLAGGALFNESWPTNSSTISSGQDLVWTEVLNDIQVTSGVIAPVTTGATCRARAEVDCATADHYAQMTVSTYTDPSSSLNLFELCCRYASAADTCYNGGYVRTTSVNRREFIRTNAGSDTIIVQEDGITNTAVGEIVKCSVVGSTLSLYRNAVLQTSATDTNITTGTRTGIKIRNTDANRVQGDNFQAADIYPGNYWTFVNRARRYWTLTTPVNTVMEDLNSEITDANHERYETQPRSSNLSKERTV